MSWRPPENFEERMKRLFVPPGVYIRHLYRRELRKGEREFPLVPFLARRDRVSLDIGANKGVYSYALLRCSAAVHAFEPNPKLFRILKSWGAGDIYLHEVALSNETGQARLLVPRSPSGYSNQGGSLSSVKVAGQECGEMVVQASRLDDLGISNVGFIKIDVEGFEMQVLEGAKATLERDRPNLQIEIEEKHTMRPLPQVVHEVCGYGYQCLCLLGHALSPFSALDLEGNHRQPKNAGDYVFNFIFIPV